ncbi:MAG: fibronectin type III domain-containing protein [Candidatus Amulumruptor caecigallinarius]|nr:fibronectin type III domain-containing protein [Candidatus Amulumruptor caecigallinarius]MCM1397040.1 fibronectin type III domain-containing protein [Candidatus Amulumruptor caecigallinarius]MCM1454024.1 fibronectin type III domain-containing protein [bacterium]
MKKHLLYALAVACLTGVPSASAESVAHAYQMGDANNAFGFISFPVSQFATPTMDKRNYGETHVSAGECVDGVLYTYEVYPDVMGGVSAYSYVVRNAATFEVVSQVIFYDNTRRVVDMTYDYTTNTMYALVEDAANTSSISTTSLCVVDLATGAFTKVGSAGDLIAVDGNGNTAAESLLTLAADAKGDLYAMGEYRQFYKLNKLTGKATQIGKQHSIATTNQFQSMAFDTEGVLYWAQCHPDYGYFLTIDPATGVPSFMAEDPNPDTKWENEGSKLGADAEVTGLWFEGKSLDKLAPAAPTDLKASVSTTSANSITLSWSKPEATLGGNALSVAGYKVYRFGTEEPIATLAADATSYNDANSPNGQLAYMVCALTDDAHGRGAVVEVFGGYDTLNPVTDLTAEIDGATVTLNWKAPTSTRNGGFADYDNITYTIWRINGSDDMVLADDVTETTYTDELTDAGTFVYSVVPVCGGVDGYACDSNPVTYAKTMGIPYFSGFEDDQDGTLWTTVNNHSNTSYGWSVTLGYAYQRYDGKYAQLKSGGSSDLCNDYLFSPAIEFTTPGTYELSYIYANGVSSDTHSWSVYLADGNTADAAVVAPIDSHSDEKTPTAWTESEPIAFTVEKAGTYHLAFHGTTTTTFATLKIDNVSIKKAPAAIPYACDFEDGHDAWTITNNNTHMDTKGTGWSLTTEASSPHGSQVLMYFVLSKTNAEYDDWAVSPAIRIDEAGDYILTFAANGKSYDTHQWEAALGTDATDFTTFATPIVSYEKAKFGSWQDYTTSFRVEQPGTYHLGLHGTGCDVSTKLHLDNIRLTRAEAGAAATVAAEAAAEPVEYYNLQGMRISKPESGIVIVRYSDGSSRKVAIK